MGRPYKYFLYLLTSFILIDASILFASDIEINEKLNSYIPSDIYLVDEEGNTVNLLEQIDKPTIITFVYYNCPGICTPLLNETQSIIDKSDLIIGEDYQMIAISFDPSDSYELAKNKKGNYLKTMQKSSAASKGWKFFTGDSNNIAKATASLGYGFKEVGGEYIHKAAMIFLSNKGKIIRYNMGINLLPSELLITVREANSGNALPKTYKKDEYCFPYVAPAYQRLNDVARAFGILTIGTALLLFLYLVIKPRLAKN
jgi:protein SCO1/2